MISLSDLCTKGVFISCGVAFNKMHYNVVFKDLNLTKDRFARDNEPYMNMGY